MEDLFATIDEMQEFSSAYQKFDRIKLDETTDNNQLSKKDIHSLFDSNGLRTLFEHYARIIFEKNINSHSRIHSQRHIVDVTLFGALIGSRELNESDLELLLTSAIFHDSGRTADDNIPHAVLSAKFALEELQTTLSPLDLSIVLTAIEFHEVSHDLPNIEEVFKDICSRYKVPTEEQIRTRKICEILKDADALDRTRFVNNARLAPQYLNFSFSKRLIRFSADLQEAYALKDLQSFDSSSIEYLQNIFTPQEILRMIRHSKMKDKNAFIYLLVNRSKKDDFRI